LRGGLELAGLLARAAPRGTDDDEEASVAETAGTAGSRIDLGQRMAFRAGQVVQELGWDEDCDDAIRIAIEDVTGTELVGEDHEDVADAVVLWWRDNDGDLVDALVDALTDLVAGGPVWLLTPKVGRNGYVDPSDVADAAPTAGLTTTTTVPLTERWSAIKLVAPKASRARR
jgi:hypothetical protein